MKRRHVPPQASAPSLAERIELLSAKRQEIIRPILEHPRDYVLLSVRAMAMRLHTDPATVVRIVRGLGFASYRDFQRHLHDLSIAFATSLDTMQSGGRVTSMPAYVRDALEQALPGLGCTLSYEEIDPDIFGEELDEPAYADVERIAAVGAVIRKKG